MKHKEVYIAVSIALAFIVAVAFAYQPCLEGIARFLVVKDELSKADVIVVLGGGGSERVEHAVKLYRAGYGKSIIATGMENKLPGLVITWPELAKREAVSLGVPEEALILEERPSSTYEDARFVREDMLERNFKSAIITSSPSHMRRVKMTFKKVFKDDKEISLKFSPSEDGYAWTKKWWTKEKELVAVINEYCKLALYFFKYII